MPTVKELESIQSIGEVLISFIGPVCCILRTACNNVDYCSPVLCSESEVKNPFPFFSRLLRHAREGLGCKHIFHPLYRSEARTTCRMPLYWKPDQGFTARVNNRTGLRVGKKRTLVETINERKKI